MTRVAIAGLGAIGRVLARRLHDGIPGLTLACAAAGNRAKAQAWLDGQGIACPLVELDEIPDHADLAVECAPSAVLERHLPADAGSRQGRHGAERGGPAGPAASDGHWRGPRRPDHRSDRGACWGSMPSRRRPRAGSASVRMTTRKPPNGLAGAPYLVANNISVEGLNAPEAGVLPAMRERRPPDSRPTSMWRRRCRWPGSGRSRPRSRSGPTRRSTGTATPSRSKRIPPVSR